MATVKIDKSNFQSDVLGAAEPVVVDEPGSFKYFEALQQDYEQMPRQQIGLRNTALEHMALVKEEVVIAHFHSVVDTYLRAAGAPV